MKIIYNNIILSTLIIIILNLSSCNDLSKSYCDEILNFSYTENDSIIKNNIIIAEKCSQKYHKDPIFFRKLSQIYYIDAINDYSKQELLSSANKLFHALDNIEIYFNNIDNIKTYDYQFRAEIYERLGDIYNDVNNLKQASILYNKAISDYEDADNQDDIIKLLLKLGKSYQQNHIHDIAMIYFEMAEEKVSKNQNIFRKIIDNKIVTLYELNDYNKADSLFRNHFNIKIQDYDYHSALGTKLFYERNYHEALLHLVFCFENGNQQEKISASEKLAEAYFNLGDSKKEMFHLQYQAKNNSNEIRRTPLKLDLEKLFDTYQNTDINDNTKERHIANKILISILAISIVIIIIVSITRRKEKSKDNIKKKNIEVKPATPEKIISKQHQNKQNYSDAYKTFTESNIYTQIKSSFEGLNILTKNVQDYGKLTLSNKDLIQIVKTFNNCFPDAIPSLKKDFEGITISDIRFIVLSFMDLNNVEIAVLLGLTYGAANKRTNKIKNIFSTNEDLHTFLTRYIQSKY